MKIVVIGGGVLGSMHAWHAVQRGHQVVHLEKDLTARSASVRNFGLVWISGRADGDELHAALRARELWADIGHEVPQLGFRANGSLTVARTELEDAVARAAAARPDADLRGFDYLDADAARRVNPALGAEILGALRCRLDAAVEPRVAQNALREALRCSGRYEFHGGQEVVDLGDGTATTADGTTHTADLVCYLPGAELGGLTRRYAGELPVRRVYLQMLQTEPHGQVLTTSVADADSFRYYPAFAGASLDALNHGQPQHPVAAEHHMQLLVVQRLDGSLTIGDTHAYDEPFPFDTDERPSRYLIERAEQILGAKLPPVRKRWFGIYAQCRDPKQVVHRQNLFERTHLVTGPGGRGMTLAPAIGEHTADRFNL